MPKKKSKSALGDLLLRGGLPAAISYMIFDALLYDDPKRALMIIAPTPIFTLLLFKPKTRNIILAGAAIGAGVSVVERLVRPDYSAGRMWAMATAAAALGTLGAAKLGYAAGKLLPA